MKQRRELGDVQGGGVRIRFKTSRSHFMQIRQASASIFAFAFLVVSALAQAAGSTYPDRPIRFLVPVSAGGGADISARAVAARLSDALGQQVVVDNRPGAAGSIALETLANAAPTGYTMGLITTTHTINRSLSKNCLMTC